MKYGRNPGSGCRALSTACRLLIVAWKWPIVIERNVCLKCSNVNDCKINCLLIETDRLLLSATIATTKTLREMCGAGSVTLGNISCNLCRSKIARQVARKIALYNSALASKKNYFARPARAFWYSSSTFLFSQRLEKAKFQVFRRTWVQVEKLSIYSIFIVLE